MTHEEKLTLAFRFMLSARPTLREINRKIIQFPYSVHWDYVSFMADKHRESIPLCLSARERQSELRKYLSHLPRYVPAVRYAVKDYIEKMLSDEPLELWEINHDELERELAAVYAPENLTQTEPAHAT